MLRTCVIDFRNGWDRHLPLIEFFIQALKLHHLRSFMVVSVVPLFAEPRSRLAKGLSILANGEVEHEKCLSDEPLVIPLDEIHIDDKLHFVEEPVEIMDREVQRLKQSRILIVKVRWNSKRGPEFT
ncbi:hypothetical protein Tco_1524716 [Tanacetum coccineum]